MKNNVYSEDTSIALLIPYANNSRTHSDEQIAQVAASIREFGFTNPILIDEGCGIIAGHGRVLAASKLGLEYVPTIMMSGLTDAQKKAYVIADNKLALNSGWDMDKLKLELDHLKEIDFDIDIIGFSDFELENMLNGDSVENNDSEWEGMPEFLQPDDMPYRTIKVHFENDMMVQDFERRMEQKVTDKTKYIYHPKQIRDDLESMRYVDEE